MPKVRTNYARGRDLRRYVALLVGVDIKERPDDMPSMSKVSKRRRYEFVFDAILTEDFNRRDYLPEAAQSRPLIRVQTTMAKLGRMANREPQIGEWYLLVVGPPPGGPRLWTATENPAASTGFEPYEIYYLTEIHHLDETSDKLSPTAHRLVPDLSGLAAYKLVGGSPTTKKPAAKRRRRIRRLYVLAIDVGQASFICIHDGTESILFFDVGKPLWFNYRSMPRRVQYPPPHADAVVVISHWDFDHFSAALTDPALRQLQWITPTHGAIGVNAKKLANQLGPRLQCVPYGTAINLQGPLTLKWATGNIVDFNNSGIVGIVRTGGRKILLTGDASYDCIATKHKTRLSGVSVPHHAAASSHAAVVPQPIGPASAVICSGVPNQYRHPSPVVIAAHAAWNVQTTGRLPNSPAWHRGNRLI